MDKFFKNYVQELSDCLDKIDTGKLTQLKDWIEQAWLDGKQIFIIGNGGSASTASHAVCDLSKGILGHKGDKNIDRLRVVSLTDNVALMTAWANDTSYDNIFLEPLKNLAKEGDLVIGISASGNSKNVVSAIELANEMRCKTIGLAGFDGGQLEKISELCITAKIERYDIAEDIHLILSHILTSWLMKNLPEKK